MGTKQFDRKLSLKLDRAVVRAERGSIIGRLLKRWIEFVVFGGKL